MIRLVGLLICVGACGNITRKSDDAGVRDDAKLIDAAPMVDASVDALIIPPQSREVVTGAGRMTGTTHTFDVQIGNPVEQRPIQGSTHKLEGNASVKP